MTIFLKYCELRPTNFGIETIFQNGSQCSNWPLNDDFYLSIVKNCGLENPLQYCREHDLSHAFLAEKMFDNVSPVLWYAANNKKDYLIGLYEERVIYEWQQYIRGMSNTCLDHNWSEWILHYKLLLDILGYELLR